MANPRITLDQWQALMAVVDAGSYAKAAEVLHKSQSSLTYAVQKLESLLGVKAFEIQGRKAVLTPTGRLLYRRARVLLNDASGLEQAARTLSAGWEAEIYLAAEVVFPTWLLLQCLGRFHTESPHTRIEVIESVLGGTNEALLQGQADLAISGRIPPGFNGDPLMRLRFIPVAHPDHPLHKLGRPLTTRDLDAHLHLVVRDSGSKRTTNALSVETSQRWTVSHMVTSIEAARMGYGFSWYPEEKIRDELAAGTLKQLPMRDGGERFAELYLIFAERDYAGPGTLRLAEIIRESTAQACTKRAQPEDAKSAPA
jgi:DNA-binding transcriptional LysR family regulator